MTGIIWYWLPQTFFQFVYNLSLSLNIILKCARCILSLRVSNELTAYVHLCSRSACSFEDCAFYAFWDMCCAIQLSHAHNLHFAEGSEETIQYYFKCSTSQPWATGWILTSSRSALLLTLKPRLKKSSEICSFLLMMIYDTFQRPFNNMFREWVHISQVWHLQNKPLVRLRQQK